MTFPPFHFLQTIVHFHPGPFARLLFGVLAQREQEEAEGEKEVVEEEEKRGVA